MFIKMLFSHLKNSVPTWKIDKRKRSLQATSGHFGYKPQKSGSSINLVERKVCNLQIALKNVKSTSRPSFIKVSKMLCEPNICSVSIT